MPPCLLFQPLLVAKIPKANHETGRRRQIEHFSHASILHRSYHIIFIQIHDFSFYL